MASTTMKFSPLVVRCIKNQKKPETDDKIAIVPLNMGCCGYSEDKLFSMKYITDVETDTKDKREVSRSIMTADTLQAYVETLLELLYRDEAPFENIQFDLPGIPSVLVSAKTLSKVRPTLEHYLHTLLVANYDAWPRIETTSKKPTKSHLFFDEDGNTVEEHYWHNYTF
jgi:hypothetical protein